MKTYSKNEVYKIVYYASGEYVVVFNDNTYTSGGHEYAADAIMDAEIELEKRCA